MGRIEEEGVMMPDRDIEKLVGGYATNSLTEQERKALFDAALHDQTLFNGLADEHALKEILDDPRARRLLIDALKRKTTPRSSLENFLRWLRGPSSWALAGSVAVAILAVTLVVRLSGPLPEPPGRADSNTPASTPREPGNLRKEELPAVPANQDVRTTTRTLSPPVPGRKPASQAPSAPSNKNDDLSFKASPLEAPQGSATVPTEQLAPEAGRRESSSIGTLKKTQTDELSEGTLNAQPPQPQALGKAREQIRPPAPTAAAKAPGVAGKATALTIRYTLLREEPGGHYAEVAPTTVFHTGDKVRLSFEPDDTGYLYVLARDTAGNTTIVFPTEGTGETGHVDKTVRYLIPLGHDFTFEEPGDLELTMIFSREPLVDVQHLIGSAQGQTADPNKTGDLEQKKAGASAEADAPIPALREPSFIIQQDITLRHH